MFFSSCSIEKRRYTSGYHIEWNKSKSKVANDSNQITVRNQELPERIQTDGAFSINENLNNQVSSSSSSSEIYLEKMPSLISDTPAAICDTIFLKSGERLEADISEVNPDVIKYKRCDHLEGPVYHMSKSEVSLIIYSNGVKEIVGPSQSQIESSGNEKSGVYGIVSFISAVIGILLGVALPGFVFIGMLLAIIFGILGLEKGRKYKGLAIAGLVIGSVILLVVFVAIIALSTD